MAKLEKVVFNRKPETDSYDEESVPCKMHFSNGEVLGVVMLGKTAYHLKHNFPNVEVLYKNS